MNKTAEETPYKRQRKSRSCFVFFSSHQPADDVLMTVDDRVLQRLARAALLARLVKEPGHVQEYRKKRHPVTDPFQSESGYTRRKILVLVKFGFVTPCVQFSCREPDMRRGGGGEGESRRFKTKDFRLVTVPP